MGYEIEVVHVNMKIVHKHVRRPHICSSSRIVVDGYWVAKPRTTKKFNIIYKRKAAKHELKK